MRALIYSFQQREVLRETGVFALVVIACVFIITMLCQTMPVDKRPIDLIVQSVFSTTMAVPASASWRLLRRSISRYRKLYELRGTAHEVSPLL